MLRRFLFCSFLFALPLFAEDLIVDLRNPTYKSGILYTTQGGVIQNKELRIQARILQYTRKIEEGKEIHRVEAEGDLLIQYKDRAFVGSELEYDFIKKSGVLYDGKTFSTIWFVGGDVIELNPDGSYTAQNAFITTCENKESSWDLRAKSVSVTKKSLFSAKNLRLRLFQLPVFWFPSFKLNLKKFQEPLFRYSLNWDRGQGPRAMARYQLYSWRDFALFGRIEYRWRTGWGGALETEYFPSDFPTTFVTRSYAATDTLETAPNKMFRYRLEGALHMKSRSEKTHATLSWDKYSDVRMPSDFQSEDFEVGTAKKTLLYLHHREEKALTFLKVRPRVNAFESIQQDLPTLYASFLPREIGRTKILSSFFAKASYLDFAYSDRLSTSLPDFHSGRIEAQEVLQRPIHLGPTTFTPYVGGIGILYTQSPSHQTRALGTLHYGAALIARAQRNYSHYKHVLEPHLECSILTRPTVSPNQHYIFSIQDGYEKIQQIQAGLRSLLFSQKRPGKEASFAADLYANAFFSDPVIPQCIPRLYLNLSWRLPSIHIDFSNIWNFRHEILDVSKARFLWTVNENVALALEGRYRSRYDWRKADHDNFILDVTRPESELLASPLSDRRITLLTRLFIRFTPFWECQIQSHHGFYRFTEDPYNEIKVDLFTWITAAWKLRISYSHTDKDDRVTAGISLVKNPKTD